MSAACSECGGVRGHLLGCTKGQHQVERRTADVAVPTSATQWSLEAERFELRARLFAPAVVLLVSFGLVSTGPGRFVLRTFFGMWLHELGHAVTSWLCGIIAVPLPWVTLGSDHRSRFFSVVLLAGLGVLIHRSVRQRRFGRVAVWSSLVLAVLVCSFFLRMSTARAFVTFWGDGGALVLGALAMSSFFARPGSRLHRGALRWGFLVIGAAAYVDVLMVWLAAWRDRAEIAFGRIEGVGLSDPSKLVDDHGWTTRQLVTRYLLVALVCAAAFGASWTRAVLQQRARVRLTERGKDPDDSAPIR